MLFSRNTMKRNAANAVSEQQDSVRPSLAILSAKRFSSSASRCMAMFRIR
jgi:hypothetical protein